VNAVLIVSSLWSGTVGSVIARQQMPLSGSMTKA
jgi:hypothetical protein